MKVIFTTHDLALGGSETALVHEANGFAKASHEVVVVTTIKHQQNDLAAQLQVPLVSFYFSSFLDIANVIKLWWWLWKFRPDVVISGSLFSTTIFKLVMLFIPHFRFIVRESNILIRHSRASKFFDHMTRWMVDVYFTNCEAIKQDLIRGIGVSASKISVIRNGIDQKYFETKKQPYKKFTILHVGSMSTRQKGQEYLIEAMRILNFKYQILIEVLFVGEGHRKSELQILARDMPYLRFLGKQKPPYGQVDLLVFPSLWEGMPNAILEAMAAGVPVIATPVGGIPEVITDHKSGILLPPKDPHAIAEAIKELKNDPALRMRLAARAKEVVSRPEFTWSYHVDRLLEIATSTNISRYNSKYG